ncbi:MAG: heavy metal translocating P-type ATPase [Lachnospiraceae bacterium]
MKKTWKIDIDCPNCAAKVERALQKLPGVVSVSLNYVQKKITLEAPADRFEEVRKAAYAKMKEIEPDAEIFFDEAPAEVQGNIKQSWKLDIDCPNCAAKVERALQKLPGVVSVSLNYVQKKITLEAPADRFEEVRKAAYAKMKEIEPDAEIFFDEAPAEVQGNIKQSWKLDIDCPNCAAKVERALQKLPGVVSVSLNYVQKKITLEAPADRFEEVRKAAYAKMKEIEPDAEIFFDEAEQPSGTSCPCGGHHHEDDDDDEHEHHHHHDGKCGCGHEHHHHDDDDDDDDHEHREHSHEHGHEHGGANKGKKLMIRVATAVALLALGLVSKANLGETHWATIVVFIAAYLVAGYDVLWRAICNIRHGEVFDENFLMTVASVGAMCVAEYAEGVAVMVLYQIGEYFQDKAVDKSRESITKLMDIRPDYANLVDGNDSRRVSPEQVRVGDIILVKPGEKIPLDGVVIEGNSSLNTTALTGESLPRDVKEGDQVLSGCVNLSGVMKVKVTVGYGESTVAKILALVESSGDAKAKTERFITKFSRIYTPAVCFFALALAIIPSLFDGNWTKWIYTALTFLVISCPCALVISVPLTFFSGIGGASKKGILIKGATYLETLAGLDTVVFDKTGTLTKGTFSVTGVHPAKGVTKDELLDVAAHAEAFSDHPIAISIKEALGRAVDMNRVSDASEAAGHGVQAKVDGQQVYAGNARLMESIGVKAAEPAEIGTVVHVARGGQYLGALVISDVIKENSASAMEALKSAGVKRLVMLTGDRKEVAADIAKKVGLTDYRAELLPEDKVSALEGLLGDGHTVAFTGDGINDAPVLRRADIGIAMGGVGADAAIEAADIVLMDDDPAKIAQGVRHARRTMRIVHQNIIFALAVKLLVMVLGICGFANMWLAVFADVGVAMLAILNAMRAMKMKQ